MASLNPGDSPPEIFRGGGRVQVGRAPQLKVVSLVGEVALGHSRDEVDSEACGGAGHTKRCGAEVDAIASTTAICAPQLKVDLVGVDALGHVMGKILSEARGADGHTKRGAKGVEGDGTCSSWMRFMDGWV